MDCDNDNAVQLEAVRNFIEQGVDYIVIAPIETAGWNTVLAEAKEAGIPVIIWSGAALADYIEQNGLGFCVDSLQDIAAKIAELSPDEYRQMRKNAASEGARIRAGFFFDRALSQVEESCFRS